ncbi:MAG TPA: hypothetical protein VGG45_16500 [Terracidiphilus sp.]|jgi:hypothetical protein
MPGWISWLLGWLFGGTKQSATDQQLGQAQQQNADLRQTAKDDARAAQIDQQVDGMTDAQLDEALKRPRP